MQIKIKVTNIELTNALESYVEEKIQSIEKFAIAHEEENPIVQVEIGKTTNHHRSGEVFRAEANLVVRGKRFHAHSSKDDLYAAIDDLREELVRELTSHKGKERALFRRGAAMVKNLIRFGRAKGDN